MKSVIGRYCGFLPQMFCQCFLAHGLPKMDLAGDRLRVGVRLHEFHHIGMENNFDRRRWTSNVANVKLADHIASRLVYTAVVEFKTESIDGGAGEFLARHSNGNGRHSSHGPVESGLYGFSE